MSGRRCRRAARERSCRGFAQRQVAIRRSTTALRALSRSRCASAPPATSRSARCTSVCASFNACSAAPIAASAEPPPRPGRALRSAPGPPLSPPPDPARPAIARTEPPIFARTVACVSAESSPEIAGPVGDRLGLRGRHALARRSAPAGSVAARRGFAPAARAARACAQASQAVTPPWCAPILAVAL